MVWNKTKHTKFSKDNGRFVSMWNSKKDKSEALRMYVEEKQSLRAIAKHFGCSHGAVQNLMESEGVIRKKTSQRFDRFEGEWKKVFPLKKYESRILKLYQKPMTCEEVSAIIGNGCLPCHVEKVAKKHKVGRSRAECVQIAKEKGRHASQVFSAKLVKYRLGLDLSDLTYYDYTYHARRLTDTILSKYRKVLKTHKRRMGKWHFDHMFSIFDGYYKLTPEKEFVKRSKPMPLRYLCHPANLNLVPAIYNSYKGGASDITFSELKSRIEEFESKHGKVF